MWSDWRAPWLVAWHTLAIYLMLIAIIRIAGRRQLSQLNVVDLVIILVLGSAVETAMVAGDTSLKAGLTSAGVLLIANRAIALAVSRSRRWRRLVQRARNAATSFFVHREVTCPPRSLPIPSSTAPPIPP